MSVTKRGTKRFAKDAKERELPLMLGPIRTSGKMAVMAREECLHYRDTKQFKSILANVKPVEVQTL